MDAPSINDELETRFNRIVTHMVETQGLKGEFRRLGYEVDNSDLTNSIVGFEDLEDPSKPKMSLTQIFRRERDRFCAIVSQALDLQMRQGHRIDDALVKVADYFNVPEMQN